MENKANEIVELIIKKHWIVHLLVLFRFLKFFVLPVLILEFGLYFIFDGAFEGKGLILNLIFILSYHIGIWLWLFVYWLINELDILIVTDKRIIEYNQINCFHRRTTTAYLGKIQDVKGERRGFLANLFAFGDLSIYTANISGKQDFFINYIGTPEEVAEKILQHVNKVKAEEAEGGQKIHNEGLRLVDLLESRVRSFDPQNKRSVIDFFRRKLICILKPRA